MEFISLIIALVFCITIHEAAHAWTAWKLGDPTAKLAGRVTLNPMKHLDVLGTIMIFIAHFGWGKPVPFNYDNLKNPRRDAAIIAMAGPFSNLLTAVMLAVVTKYLPVPMIIGPTIGAIYWLSLILFLFNILPIAPLDGSKLIGLVVPAKYEHEYYKFMSQGPMYIILLIVFDRLISEISGFSFLGLYLSYGGEVISALIKLGT